MNIEIIKSALTPLCYLPSGKLICYQYGDVVILNSGKEEKRFPVFRSKKERFGGRCRYLYRLLRLGIRTSIALDETHILLSIGNYLYELDLISQKLSNGYFCGEGIRPLIFTSVNGLASIDNGVYFGGYLGNMTKKPVHIYKRESCDKWKIVYTFSQGLINHVHTIISDPYRDCLWIFTGDFDESSAIWKVTDHFKKIERVCYNDQKYRGCIAFALAEGILYATDAPFAKNFIYLINPETLEVNPIISIAGSCIYGGKWKDKYVFSSTVEGDGRNMSRMEFFLGRKRGAGIQDEYVHLYIGNVIEGFQELYKEKKDRMPFYTFQFGVFKFPYGINKGDALYFQPIATMKNDLKLLCLRKDIIDKIKHKMF